MIIYINGNPVKTDKYGMTLDRVFSEHPAPVPIISLSVNDIPVPRSLWKLRLLNDLDRIDYV